MKVENVIRSLRSLPRGAEVEGRFLATLGKNEIVMVFQKEEEQQGQECAERRIGF